MVPIPEGVERDEEEPSEEDDSTGTESTDGPNEINDGKGPMVVDLKTERRWTHKGQEELNLFE